MSRAERLTYRASLDDYRRHAEALFDELKSGDESAQWRVKWDHPRFRDKSVGDVKAAVLELADAQLIVAREHGFDTWAELAEFAASIARGGSAERFETAVEAVVSGDVAKLRAMLRETPELARARSTRRHHATLLHYVAANGVEGERQKTPAYAVDVARVLLEAGSEVDALADMYENRCTTMSMLVSSGHPAEAGLQVALAETLLEFGAALEGPGSKWQSSVMTALAFGYLDTARMLASRGARIDDIAAAAGLGRLEDARRLLPTADGKSRHAALALAAQHGHAEIVRLLLDAGEDPNRYNLEGFHAHSMPLHQAVWSKHIEVVRLLVERGARLDVRDTIYQSTPLGWAIYGERNEIAEYLRGKGAPAE
jgi:ankyrin repeat protein